MHKTSRVVIGRDDDAASEAAQRDPLDAQNSDAAKLDAGALQDALVEAYKPDAPRPAPPKASRLGSWLKRNLVKVAKVAVAVAVIAVVGWQPLQKLATSASVEAVVNARLVTLRAPIEGTIALAVLPAPGNKLEVGQDVVKVTDPRADRSRLDDLRRTMQQLEDERATLSLKRESALHEMQDSGRQVARFQGARARQLESRMSEIRAEIRAAAATREELAAARARAEMLVQKSAGSTAQLERARRDELVAEQTMVAAQDRLAMVGVELEAIREGYFVGDSYNDRPRSLERLQEARERAAELQAEIALRDARLARLASELERETQRTELLAEARLTAPAGASVWEVLISDREQVRRGQDLVRLLDCSAPLVTATVSEGVFNRLHIGAPATFRLKDTRDELAGHVVHMSGQAEVAANLAIAPSYLQKEPYRVTVAVPDLARGGTCPIGRTGRVTFDASAASAPGR